MDTSPIKIKAVTIWPNQAEYVVCSSVNLVPGTGASGNLILGNLVETAPDTQTFQPIQGGITSSMTPEQYAKWGTDDEYAVDCFIANAGLERA